MYILEHQLKCLLCCITGQGSTGSRQFGLHLVKENPAIRNQINGYYLTKSVNLIHFGYVLQLLVTFILNLLLGQILIPQSRHCCSGKKPK